METLKGTGFYFIAIEMYRDGMNVEEAYCCLVYLFVLLFVCLSSQVL